MSTSDGISEDDWDVVQQLAIDALKASDANRRVYEEQLLRCLDCLELKYGPLPSILATRADYIDPHDPSREPILMRALRIAEQRRDPINLVYVTQSLSELCLERGDLAEADRWLLRMRDCLALGDDLDLSEYDRLRAEYRRRVLRPA